MSILFLSNFDLVFFLAFVVTAIVSSSCTNLHIIFHPNVIEHRSVSSVLHTQPCYDVVST